MYRRKTSYECAWHTNSSSPETKATPVVVQQKTISGRFGLIVYSWDWDFIDIHTTVLDEPVYSDQTKITCGSRPVVHAHSCDFFDGTRMYVRDVSSRQLDDSFRPVRVHRDLDEDHFEITQPSHGTFVLTCLSAAGTKVNGRIVHQGTGIVLKRGDVIEDRVVLL
jgi:hypothetical protein